jgi:magnesium-protoporphyrin O-methyltransferase
VTCCSIPCADTNRFFSRLAGLHRWRFRVFGFEKTQQQLIDGIQQAGSNAADLLEIGCGVGYLHQALLQAGARTATGVDLSERMLVEARQLAQATGLGKRTEYLQGDFVGLADVITHADITIMDKVVCCYPEPEQLLNAALDKTRHMLALTYPRDRLSVRLWVAIAAFFLKRFGSEFRPFVHSPADIERWITAREFHRQTRVTTPAWITEIYTRTP